MRDLRSDFNGTIALALAAKAKSGSPFTSSAIDLAGFEGCMLEFTAGALGTEVNTYTLTITDGDTNAAADTPVTGYMIGTPVHQYATTPAAIDTSSTVKLASYIGGKRWIKVILTVAGTGTGSGVCGVNVIRGHAKHAPVA
jgi:hypothetical protein